mmetsp:Transcript_13358/g.27286  ORF Transcript_13358/g.27286 Transcript_13358/m.27286 type:complete len:229 (-) Transcript_13358:1621-2307(-)
MKTTQTTSYPRNTTPNTSITPTSPTSTPILQRTHGILPRQSRRIRSIPRSRIIRRNIRLFLLRRSRRHRRHPRHGRHSGRHGRCARRRRHAGCCRWQERRRRCHGSGRCHGTRGLRVIHAIVITIARREENATAIPISIVPAGTAASAVLLPTSQKPLLPSQEKNVIVPAGNERSFFDSALRPDGHLVLTQLPVRTRHHHRGMAIDLVSDAQLSGAVVSHRVDGAVGG